MAYSRPIRKVLTELRKRLSHRPLWRLMWLGQVTPNPKIWSEHTIEVAFTPLRADDVDQDVRAGRYAIDPSETVIVPLAVGLLPRMIVGSIWQGGRIRVLPRYSRTRFRVGDPTLSSLARDWGDALCSQTGVSGDPLIPYDRYSIRRSEDGKNGLGARCVGVDVIGDRPRLLISCAEIARFFLATSTEMALLLLSSLSPGNSDEEREGHGKVRHINEMYDLSRSSYDEESGEVVLRLREGMRHTDIAIIAWIFCSARARSVARGIFPALVRARVEGKPASIEAHLPFEGAADLEVEGLPVEAWAGGRKLSHFLVTRIVSCRMAFPFSALSWSREGDGDTHLLSLPSEGTTQEYRSKERKRAQGPRGGRIGQDNAPEVRLGREREYDLERRFPGLESIPKYRMQARTLVGRRQNGPPVEDSDREILATAPGTHSATGVTGYSVSVVVAPGTEYRPPREERTSIENLAAFAEALRILREAYSVNVTVRPVTAYGEIDERYQSSPLSGAISPEWAGEGASGGRRQVMIAELEDVGRYFYFIEAEHPLQTRSRFLSMAKVTSERLTDEELTEILDDCERVKSKWQENSPRDDLHWHRSNHPEAKPLDSFSQRWAEAILARKGELERGIKKKRKGTAAEGLPDGGAAPQPDSRVPSAVQRSVA